MPQQTAFAGFKLLDCPSPVTSPKYLGNMISELEKIFHEVDPKFLEWFKAGLEQGPFINGFHLGYAATIADFSYASLQTEAATFSATRPSLMQILIGAKGLGKNLTPGHRIVAIPGERYRNKECQVIFIEDGGQRKILLELVLRDVLVSEGTGYIFGLSTSVLPNDAISLPGKTKNVPFFKSERL